MPLGGHMQKDREKPLERDQEGQNHEVPDRVIWGGRRVRESQSK